MTEKIKDGLEKLKEEILRSDISMSKKILFDFQIDDLLEEHKLPKRYLDRVSTINENGRISLDDDLLSLDFRVKEILDDLINRINTRIAIVKDETMNLLGIQKQYDLENIDLDHELEVSMLDEKYYI